MVYDPSDIHLVRHGPVVLMALPLVLGDLAIGLVEIPPYLVPA